MKIRYTAVPLVIYLVLIGGNKVLGETEEENIARHVDLPCTVKSDCGWTPFL